MDGINWYFLSVRVYLRVVKLVIIIEIILIGLLIVVREFVILLFVFELNIINWLLMYWIVFKFWFLNNDVICMFSIWYMYGEVF